MHSRALGIAGMHRSGTSLVARLLNACGLYLGPENQLAAGEAHTPEGYAAQMEFVAISEGVLAALGGGWDAPPAALSGSAAQPALLPLRVQAAGLCQRFDDHADWGWSDPRISLTWPFWKSIIPGLRVVICVRDPLEVAQSLARMGRSTQAFTLNLWLTYYQRLLAETRPEDRLVTHFGSYFHDARAELKRLIGWLQLPPTEAEIDRAGAIVAAAQRHVAVTPAELLAAALPDVVLSLYAALCAESGPVYRQTILEAPGQAGPGSTITPTPGETQYAAALQLSRFQAKLEAARRQHSEEHQLDQQTILDLKTRLAESEQSLARLAEQLADRDRSLAQLSARLTEKEAARAHLAARLAETENRVTRLSAQNLVTGQALGTAEEERAELAAHNSRLRDELVAVYSSRAWRMVQRWYRLRHLSWPGLGTRNEPALIHPLAAPIKPRPSAPEARTMVQGRVRLGPKILFVSHDANRHGAQILLLSLLEWLKRNTNFDFELLLAGDGELRADFEALSRVTLLNHEGRALSMDRQNRLLTQLRQANTRLVYANTITMGGMLEALSPLACPTICHVHELDYWIKHKTDPGNNRAIKRYATRYIAVSQAVKRSLVRNLGVADDLIDVIYGFVPAQISLAEAARAAAKVRQRLAIAPGAFVVGASGTTDWRKGADLFVQLARDVLARQPSADIHFVWLGGEQGGPLFGTLEHDISRSGIGARLHFLGARPNPLDYMAAFDVFALVSREDPFPLVMLEAASLGVPTICFDGAGGANEFVDGETGFVVPYLDLDAMAGHILELAHDPDLRTRLGRCAGEKVRQRHDVEAVGPQVEDVIRRMLAVP